MIMLTGASGTLGKEITKQLVKTKKKFKCLVRQTSNVQELEEMGAPLCYGDVSDPQSLTEAMKGVKSVISTHTLGRPRKDISYWDVDYAGNKTLIDILKENGGGKFVFISGLRVSFDSAWDLYKIKRAVEGLLEVSGLDYTVLRPSGFFSDFTMSAGMVKKYHIYPAMGGKKHVIQGIHQADLAFCAVDALTNKKASNKIFSIGGPEAITSKEVAALYSKLLGKKVRVLPIPVGVPKTIGTVVDTFTGYKYGIRGMIDAFSGESISDNTALLDAFNIELTSLEEYLTEFMKHQ